jgi:steroid delta-isomerase-like uncharacterized protein
MAVRRRRKQSTVRRNAAVATIPALVAGVGTLWRYRRSNGMSERSLSMEANKKASKRIFEDVFTQGRFEVVDELVHDDALGHDPALPEPTRGPEGLKESARGYRAAFPDLHVSIDQQVAEGDLVATRWTARGTHKGELFGIAPTGKESIVTGMTIDRFKNGKIAESYTNWDTLGMLQQIGAVPTLVTTAG